MEKENRRTRITKLLLTDSFLHLLEQKPLSRVTVKDICDYADLNRSTYYRYFTDPYDQMTKLEVEIIEEMAACVDDHVKKEGQPGDISGLYPIILQVLRYIESKREMFHILLSNNGDLSLQKDILTVLAGKLLPEDFKEPTSKGLLQKYIFISNGSFGIIYYWLMADTKETIENLAKQITEYCFSVFHR